MTDSQAEKCESTSGNRMAVAKGATSGDKNAPPQIDGSSSMWTFFKA